MQLSKVPIKATDLWLIVQGFRAGTIKMSDEPDAETVEFEPTITLAGWADGKNTPEFSMELTAENANIISEEIRKHAEFAQTVREQGE